VAAAKAQRRGSQSSSSDDFEAPTVRRRSGADRPPRSVDGGRRSPAKWPALAVRGMTLLLPRAGSLWLVDAVTVPRCPPLPLSLTLVVTAHTFRLQSLSLSHPLISSSLIDMPRTESASRPKDEPAYAVGRCVIWPFYLFFLQSKYASQGRHPSNGHPLQQVLCSTGNGFPQTSPLQQEPFPSL